MRIHHLTRSQPLPISLAEAWPFFSTPRNLEAITPDFLRFRITSEVPEDIYAGLIITYRIAAVADIPMTWVTALLGFVLFRLFDVFKPFPVRSLERIPGYWGIVADDLGAGLYAWIILFVLFR